MPVINRIGDLADEMTEWRRYLHTIPELSFDCPETAAFIAGKLRDFGITEIHEGIAQTGIVAIIKGDGEGPTIGLRAGFRCLADRVRHPVWRMPPPGPERCMPAAMTGIRQCCWARRNTSMRPSASRDRSR